MKKNKKIIIAGSYPESLVNFRGKLLETLASEGHEVIAIAPDAPEPVQRKIIVFGCRYIHLPINRTGTNPFFDLRTFFAFAQLFRREKPDIFLCYTIKPVIFGMLAARFTAVRECYAIITGLGYAFSLRRQKWNFLRPLVLFLYRQALKTSTLVFFQNEDDCRTFRQLSLLSCSQQTKIIHGSGVDLQHYTVEPCPEKPVRFLMIARLLKDKGVYEYVQAARLIKEHYPDVECHLVGWCDTNPASIHGSEVEKWSEEGIIHFWGKLEDVRVAIKRCSVYVLPSYREGTPRTTLEAMSMGRAVVTTDVPGCRETVIEGVNGFLVPVQNVKELMQAMEQFVVTPGLIQRMGRESRRLAEKKYDVHAVNRSLMAGMNLVE